VAVLAERNGGLKSRHQVTNSCSRCRASWEGRETGVQWRTTGRCASGRDKIGDPPKRIKTAAAQPSVMMRYRRIGRG